MAQVYLVGEPVPQPVKDKWTRSPKLYNMYGPTEGTCGATIKRLLPGARVTIGAPNPSTRTYIPDSQGEMAITGVIGEIYIAGVQVAKEYISLPDETGSKFLRDHISCNGEQMNTTIPLLIVIEIPAIRDLATAVDSFISHENSPLSRERSFDEHILSLLEADWLK